LHPDENMIKLVRNHHMMRWMWFHFLIH